MKIILVSPEVSDGEQLKSILDKFGRSTDMLFQYHHPLKAIDNMEEILPDLVLWSYPNFPRHWKPMIPYIEDIKNTNSMKLVLYSHSKIAQAEIDKAGALQVDAIIQQGLSSPEAVNLITFLSTKFYSKQGLSSPEAVANLNKLLVDMSTNEGSSPSDATEKPAAHFDMNKVLNSVRYIPSKSESIHLIMSHPLNLKILSGTVTALSLDSIKFIPAKSDDFTNLPNGTILQKCHLHIREHKLILNLKMKSSADSFDLVIQNPEKKYHPILTQLLAEKKA